MINQISIWQMVVDLCLVTSILVMAFRYIKSSRVQALLPHAVEIEASLRRIISDAETAARHINEQLLRREQNIHKYVGDVERHEKQLSLSVVEAESLTKELSLICESARREAKEIATILRKNEAPAESRAPEAPAMKHTVRAEAEPQEDVQFTTRIKSPRASEWTSFEEDETPPPAAKEISPVQALQQLYGKAEILLKEGRKAEEVSRATKLPMEGVKRLAEMIEIEREEEQEQQRTRSRRTSADPRLGALSASRREEPSA